MDGEPLSLLIVEDDPDHAELILRSLEDNRMVAKIHHVSDGQAALDYILRQGEYADPEKSPRPHVILLDLRLPKVDGLDVLKRIKEDPDVRNIPVVVLTTSDAGRDITEAYERSVNSYLVKPLDFEKFTDLMRELGFYWLGWNRNPL
jgi:CheY-like chemotaxis protein